MKDAELKSILDRIPGEYTEVRLTRMERRTKGKLEYSRKVYIPVLITRDESIIYPVKDTTAGTTGTFVILSPKERFVVRPPEADAEPKGSRGVSFRISMGSMDAKTKKRLKYPEHIYVPVFTTQDGKIIYPARDTDAKSTGTFAILSSENERFVIKPPEAKEDAWGFWKS